MNGLTVNPSFDEKPVRDLTKKKPSKPAAKRRDDIDTYSEIEFVSNDAEQSPQQDARGQSMDRYLLLPLRGISVPMFSRSMWGSFFGGSFREKCEVDKLRS